MSRLIREKNLISEINPKSTISEVYRGLRTNIEFSNRGEALKTIVFTSALPGEGKSTTSANVAVAYAQTNRKVLLIDADLRTPVQHQLFELSNHFGLSTALTGHGELDEVIQKTNIDKLHVITAGPIPSNPSELLESKAMTALLEAMKELFDIIIIDTSSVMTVTDAQVVASKSDGVVLVIKSGKVRNEMALKAKSALEYGKATVIGAVLNGARR